MIINRSRKCRDQERGYVLLVLLLSVALLSIGFTIMIRGIEFEIKRDREEELIHRGVQYSRAVRKFIKAFGRYPNSIEELESTNNMRFLRRRYKDPITGKDFKILHLMDLPSAKPVMGGTTVASMISRQSNTARSINNTAEDPSPPVTSDEADLQTSPPDDQNAMSSSQPETNGTDATRRSERSSAQPAPGLTTAKLGSGPMVGVASLSKKTTIREFDRKNHYNEWQFVYDPSTDSGGLLRTPNQPGLRAAQLANQQNEHSFLRAFGPNPVHHNPADGAQLESSTSQ